VPGCERVVECVVNLVIRIPSKSLARVSLK